MTAEANIKRKRIVNSQSRNGCYTCKARRIKCDETKPTCLRCERSKHECLGYRDPSPNYDREGSQCDATAAWQSSLTIRQRSRSPKCALSYGLEGDPVRNRFASLGSTALQHGIQNVCGRGSFVWSVTLPQYNCSVPVVASALAALGAALDSRSEAKSAIPKLYGAAVTEMQNELSHSDQPRECLPIACLLLGAADVIQWHEASAMTHVNGAFALLRARQGLPSALPTPGSDKDNTEPILDGDEHTFVPMDELDLLFVQLDLQTASYALGIPPRLPRIDLQRLLNIPADERQHSDLELEVTQAVHSSYRVAHALSRHKYVGRPRIPNDLAFQQARSIAQLLACLNILGRHMKISESSVNRDETSRKMALVLRGQCLASFIYLSMITTGPECGYDAYVSLFQQIVTDAELLFAMDSEYSSGAGQFSIGLGILQSLFLTATKYRDPTFRRRAISLLRKGGREGPWYGPLLAAVASRAVEIEEGPIETRGFKAVIAADIEESTRLHGIGIDSAAMTTSIAPHFDLMLSRCYDVAVLPFDAKPDDKAHWDMWTEPLYW